VESERELAEGCRRREVERALRLCQVLLDDAKVWLVSSRLTEEVKAGFVGIQAEVARVRGLVR
jgi:hypothetical protein